MIGSVLGGRYEVVREAESDGIFDGYKGFDKASGQDVYLRAVKAEVFDADFAASLGDVVMSLDGIRHNGIERIHGIERSPDQAVLVSDYFEGASLETRLRRLAHLSVPLAVEMAIEVCEALAPLHAADIVHGDVSPKTVFVTKADSVKLTAPGFWKAYSHSEKAARMKVRDMSVYLAPEVSAGAMPSALSDIYAVGILLWQLIGGRPPYTGDSPVAVAAKHASQPYPSLRAVMPAVPEALDKLIEKATSKNPLHRYVSVQMLLHDLRQVQDALRFGRPLTWPLSKDSQELESKVAPELNALDAKPQDGPVGKQKRAKERDVSDALPVWLSSLVYVMSALILVVLGAWVFFNLQRPKSLTVPDLIGRSVDEARQELKEQDLKLREVERQASDQFAKDTIISLAPAPGEDVKQFSYIDAVVSSGSRFVELPDLRGRPLSEVRQMLNELDLKLEAQDIDYQRDRELPRDVVLEQLPEPLSKVERFTRIRLTLSNGNERVDGGSGRIEVRAQEFKMVVPTSLEGDVEVRVDVTDENGTRTIYEARHRGGDEILEEITIYGDSALFRVFFDGTLAKTETKSFVEEE